MCIETHIHSVSTMQIKYLSCCCGIFKFYTFCLCIAQIFSHCLSFFFLAVGFIRNAIQQQSKGNSKESEREKKNHWLKMNVWAMIMWNESTWHEMTHFISPLFFGPFFMNYWECDKKRQQEKNPSKMMMRNGIWFSWIEGFWHSSAIFHRFNICHAIWAALKNPHSVIVRHNYGNSQRLPCYNTIAVHIFSCYGF